MSRAVAICIDLTCVMAARERQRDKRLAIAARRMSWPVAVLAGGILLSLAANLAQAQPPAWGRITAATPPGAFLTAVSMLERRAATRRPVTHPGPAPDVPGRDRQPAVPGQDGGTDGRSWPVRPSRARPDPPLPGLARRAAASHHDTRGQPITRDALRSRLGISTQHASDLLRQIRTPQENQLDLNPGTPPQESP